MSKYSSEYEELNALHNYTSNLVEGFDNSSGKLGGAELANQLKSNIEQQQGNISTMDGHIQDKDEELTRKLVRSRMQQREIDYKNKLITTRDRMLQLSQESNVYKGKVVYSLLATVIILVCIMLAVYIYFTKK